jgi:hypothetical protein
MAGLGWYLMWKTKSVVKNILINIHQNENYFYKLHRTQEWTNLKIRSLDQILKPYLRHCSYASGNHMSQFTTFRRVWPNRNICHLCLKDTRIKFDLETCSPDRFFSSFMQYLQIGSNCSFPSILAHNPLLTSYIILCQITCAQLNNVINQQSKTPMFVIFQLVNHCPGSHKTDWFWIKQDGSYVM